MKNNQRDSRNATLSLKNRSRARISQLMILLFQCHSTFKQINQKALNPHEPLTLLRKKRIQNRTATTEPALQRSHWSCWWPEKNCRWSLKRSYSISKPCDLVQNLDTGVANPSWQPSNPFSKYVKVTKTHSRPQPTLNRILSLIKKSNQLSAPLLLKHKTPPAGDLSLPNPPAGHPVSGHPRAARWSWWWSHESQRSPM